MKTVASKIRSKVKTYFTSVPGWHPLPHKYKFLIGVRYPLIPANGRAINNWSHPRPPWKIFPKSHNKHFCQKPKVHESTSKHTDFLHEQGCKQKLRYILYVFFTTFIRLTPKCTDQKFFMCPIVCNYQKHG